MERRKMLRTLFVEISTVYCVLSLTALAMEPEMLIKNSEAEWNVDNIISVLEGMTAHLACNASTSEEHEVRWVRIGKLNEVVTRDLAVVCRNCSRKYRIKHEADEWTLQISKLQESDTGQYECQFVIGAQEIIQVTLVRLEVLIPVSFDDDYDEERHVEGNSINFTCKATAGYPPPSYSWSRGTGKPLPIHPQFTNENFGEIFVWESEFLPLGNIQRTHSDTYVCTANNSFSESTFEIGLFVHFPPTVTTPSPIVNASLGSSVILKCTVSARSIDKFLWKRQGKVVTANWEGVQLAHDYLGGGKTEFYMMIERLEKKNFTRYQCIAESELGDASASITLTEVGQQTTKSTVPLPSVYPTLVGIVGGNLTLPCVIKDVGNSKIHWSKGSQLLSINGKVEAGVSPRFFVQRVGHRWYLNITNVKIHDEGEYNCRLPEKWTLVQTKQLYVYGPAIIPELEDIVVLQGMLMNLSCNPSGYPDPTVEWVRTDGKPISVVNHTDKEVFSWNGQDLQLHDIKRSDAGLYECIAANNFLSYKTTVRKELMIFVIFKPLVEAVESNVNVSVGDNATLACSVEAFPTPRVYWDANGMTVGKSNRFVQQVDYFDNDLLEATLTITEVRLEDIQSTFRCIARNSVGIGTAQVQLVTSSAQQIMAKHWNKQRNFNLVLATIIIRSCVLIL